MISFKILFIYFIQREKSRGFFNIYFLIYFFPKLNYPARRLRGGNMLMLCCRFEKQEVVASEPGPVVTRCVYRLGDSCIYSVPLRH